jgi:hypothetical protein
MSACKSLDSKTIHELMRSRTPITYNGVQYDRIAEYISWYDMLGKHNLSVVLIRGNYSIRVLADKISL